MHTQSSKSIVLIDANSYTSVSHVCWVEILAYSYEVIDNFHWSSGVVQATVRNIDGSTV